MRNLAASKVYSGVTTKMASLTDRITTQLKGLAPSHTVTHVHSSTLNYGHTYTRTGTITIQKYATESPVSLPTAKLGSHVRKVSSKSTDFWSTAKTSIANYLKTSWSSGKMTTLH